MNLKKTTVFVLCFFLSVLLVGAVYAQSKPLELKFNYSMPKGSAPANGWEWFGEELEKQTNGKVKVTMYPMQSLFKQPNAVDNIVGRTAELANISTRSYATKFPYLSITLLPTIKWPATIEGTVAGGKAVMKLINEFPALKEELSDVKVVWVNMMDGYSFFAKKPIYKPADLNGRKIGAGGMQGDFVRKQGASAVSIIPPKSYMNLKTGVVDTMVMSWNAVGHYKLWEVVGHACEVIVGTIAMPIIMNKEAWNSLTPDIQEKILTLGEQSLTISTKGFFEGGVKGRKQAIEKGIEVFTPTKEQNAVWLKAFEPLEAEWLAKMQKKGLTHAPKLLTLYKQAAADAAK